MIRRGYIEKRRRSGRERDAENVEGVGNGECIPDQWSARLSVCLVREYVRVCVSERENMGITENPVNIFR